MIEAVQLPGLHPSQDPSPLILQSLPHRSIILIFLLCAGLNHERRSAYQTVGWRDNAAAIIVAERPVSHRSAFYRGP